MGVVEAAAKDGIGVLLIEQFTHLGLEIADHAYVLNRGRFRFDGAPAELKANLQLLEEAYLAASAERDATGDWPTGHTDATASCAFRA